MSSRARVWPDSWSPGPTSTRANMSPSGPSGWPGSPTSPARPASSIVLKDKAAIFVDGRYTIQVREQVDAQLFEIRHLINEPPEAWIAANLKKGEVLGFDPWLTTPRCRPALPRGRAQGRRRAEGGRPQPAGCRLGRPAAGADRADLAAGDEPRRPQRRREARADRQEAEGAGPGRRGDLGARIRSPGCSTSAAATCRARRSRSATP